MNATVGRRARESLSACGRVRRAPYQRSRREHIAALGEMLLIAESATEPVAFREAEQLGPTDRGSTPRPGRMSL
jgi:hypothetical protein